MPHDSNCQAQDRCGLGAHAPVPSPMVPVSGKEGSMKSLSMPAPRIAFGDSAFLGALVGCSNDAYLLHLRDTRSRQRHRCAAGSGARWCAVGWCGGFFLDGSGGSTADAKEAGDASGECQADVKTESEKLRRMRQRVRNPSAFRSAWPAHASIDTCAPGRYDNNKNPKDGCEYACTPSKGGTEVCNGLDDNCDGTIDEGFEPEVRIRPIAAFAETYARCRTQPQGAPRCRVSCGV